VPQLLVRDHRRVGIFVDGSADTPMAMPE